MDIKMHYGNMNFVIVSAGLVIIIYLISLKIQKKRGMLFGNIELLEKISGGRLFGSRTAQLVLRVLAVILIVMSFTNFTVFMKTIRASGKTIIALDTSSSMMTPDFVPNRLEAAKMAVGDIIKEMPDNSQIGLVTFSGKAYLKVPPTSDREKLLSVLSNVTTEEPAGTSISDALVIASSLVNSSNDRIVLITDGKNNAGLPLNDSLKRVRSSGAKVNVVGIGTVKSLESIIKQLKGNYTINMTELPVIDSSELEEIANQTNGTFEIITDESNFTNMLEGMAFKREFRDIKVYKYLLMAALILVLADWFLGLTKFSVLGE